MHEQWRAARVNAGGIAPLTREMPTRHLWSGHCLGRLQLDGPEMHMERRHLLTLGKYACVSGRAGVPSARDGHKRRTTLPRRCDTTTQQPGHTQHTAFCKLYQPKLSEAKM